LPAPPPRRALRKDLEGDEHEVDASLVADEVRPVAVVHERGVERRLRPDPRVEGALARRRMKQGGIAPARVRDVAPERERRGHREERGQDRAA